MTRFDRATGLACTSLLAIACTSFSAPAFAQDSDKPITAWEASRTVDDDATIKTGVAKARDPLDSATSTSVIKDNEIVKLGAPSLADLFRNIPGFRVEGGAGEGLNAYTVRGLPLVNGGAKYIQFQEDGLPVLEFGDLANMGPDAFVRADLNVGSVESIRGGSASTFASNAPGGVVNLISKTGDVEGGSVQLSAGLDHNSNRIDFDYGGRLSDSWRFHVGGFYRRGEGPRETGYIATRGGQIKFNATKQFSGGYIRFYGKFLDDKFPAYTASAMAVSGTNADPVYSKLPGFDVVKDTAMSRYIGNVPQVDPSGNVVSTDTHSGYRVNVKSAGVEAQFKLGEWTFVERLRYSDISGHAVILDPQLNSLPSTVIGYFAPGGSLAYASGANQGTTADLTANGGSGFLAFTTVGRTNINSLQNVTNDFRASRVWEVGGGDLTTTAGLYKSYQDIDRDYSGSSILQTVQGNGNAVLLNLINAAGINVTRSGVYAYDDSLNPKRRVNVTYDVLAPYASFNFHKGAIAVGGSIRYDRGKVSGTVAQASSSKIIDVNGDGIVGGDLAELGVDRLTRVALGVPYIASGASRPIDYDYDYVSYSLSVNYRVAEAFSLFARHSLGGRAGADALLFSPAISATTGDLLLQSASHDKVRQTEAGFKFRNNGITVNLTGFYATTSGTYLPTLPDPVYGIKTPTLVSRSYKTYGAELEGAIRRGPFSVAGSLTLTGGEITAAETAALVGKQPRRQPTLIYTLTPQYDGDHFTIGANLLGQTSSYTDDVNKLRMPGFATVGLFAQVRPVDRLVLGVNVSNLFNKTAIMEVNSGAIPTSGVATVRTLYGRLVSASARFFF